MVLEWLTIDISAAFKRTEMTAKEKNNRNSPRGGGAAANEPPDSTQASSTQLDQNRYRLFFEQASDGFYETNRAGEFIFFNDAFCTIVGRTRADLNNRSYRDVMDAVNANLTAHRLSQISGSDQATRMKWNIIYREGQMRALDVTVRSAFDNDGRHTGFRGTVRDVTQQIQTQKSIRESKEKIEQLYNISKEAERRYHAFLEFLPLPFMVQNNDLSVAYINPAFQKTFGWTREDFELNPFAHIPPDQVMQTRTGKLKLFYQSELGGVETKCITKDGRILDVKSYGSVFYDQDNHPTGIVVALRNVTRAKKNAETSHALFSIAKAMHHYGSLDSRLAFISSQIKSLLHTDAAHIILIDREHGEFYFRAGSMPDSQSYHPVSQTRVKLDDTYLPGQVILSAEPQIINEIDEEKFPRIIPGRKLHNVICVPMELGDQIIGAVVASNKLAGKFDQEDSELLSTIAGMVALPIENARINDELRHSYEEIKVFNHAKDQIIDHLSHELRTPLSVLSASLEMLQDSSYSEPTTIDRILARCQRNLKRITAMEAKLADIIRDPDKETYQTVTALIELCIDELESLVDMEVGPSAGKRIRKHIDELFKPREVQSQHISLASFVLEKVEMLKPNFSHRMVDISFDIKGNEEYINLPVDVLSKIVTGLVRNAVEFTPDGGKITISVAVGNIGPTLTISDTGIGITQENQQLIFGNYFTTADISRYRTGRPYDFNAGGSGFDLLRIRVFSERYQFKIILHSKRCHHIPTDADTCPGSTKACIHCKSNDHCYHTGGTSFTIQFRSSDITETSD